jgi:hypothetical protein
MPCQIGQPTISARSKRDEIIGSGKRQRLSFEKNASCHLEQAHLKKGRNLAFFLQTLLTGLRFTTYYLILVTCDPG